MSVGNEWSVAESAKLVLDEPVTRLDVRLCGGAVNVVGTAAEVPARLEISDVQGPPVRVELHDGTLTVAYEDLPWQGFLDWLGGRMEDRSATVTVAVPAATRVQVGTIKAGAVVSGISGGTVLRGVKGDSTLVELAGDVRADTVSGAVEAQAVAGDLRFHSVSGDLTVVGASGRSLQANSVSGHMVLDLAPFADGVACDVRLATVSGEIALRLPHPGNARVEAGTTSGTVSNDFDELRVTGSWGTRRITGRLGDGRGTVKANTVSGPIALLRRPLADAGTSDADHEKKVL